MDTWGLRQGWAAPQLSPRQGGPGARVLGLGGLACSVGRRSLSSRCSPLLLLRARTRTHVFVTVRRRSAHLPPGPPGLRAGPSSVPAFRAGPPGNRPAARRAARSHCFLSCADGRGVSPDESAKREDLDVPASEAVTWWSAVRQLAGRAGLRRVSRCSRDVSVGLTAQVLGSAACARTSVLWYH